MAISVKYRKGSFTVTATVTATPTTIFLYIYDREENVKINGQAMNLVSFLTYEATFQSTSAWLTGEYYAIVKTTTAGIDDYSQIDFDLERLNDGT